jgi:hypothetical protein
LTVRRLVAEEQYVVGEHVDEAAQVLVTFLLSAQRSEESFVLFCQFVPIPALRLSECSSPVLGFELGIVPEALDHSHPRRHLLRGRPHIAGGCAPIRDRKHEPGIAQGLR